MNIISEPFHRCLRKADNEERLAILLDTIIIVVVVKTGYATIN